MTWTLLQPTAAIVVFGGTGVALLVGFPLATLWRTLGAVRSAFSRPAQRPRELVARFAQYAVPARRRGLMALEPEIANEPDTFLVRALTLAIDGIPQAALRQALEIDSHAREDADLQCADVLEAAAGYAPTLGILGAVLGLIHVMEHFAAPSAIGSGIAVAFVATVYGVASANLVFLPIATRIRGRASAAVLSRAVIIEGTVSLQQGLHPRMIETHLDGFVREEKQKEPVRAA